MIRWFSTLTLNGRLAVVALLLGTVAIAATPARGSGGRIDAAELASIVAREVDHVSVRDLADWIIQGRADYRLIDLRDEKSYAAYHIPTAEHAPMATIAEYPMDRNQRIVLYSDGGIHSAQAWFLLRAKGFKGAYILSGGLDEWKDQILFPRLAADATPAEVKAFEAVKAVSARFGGRPIVGASSDRAGTGLAELPLPEMPNVVAPAGGLGAKAPVRKKREGC